MFQWHWSDCYLTDLKTLESKGMLASDCIIVADNVVFPGAPGYLEYVSSDRINNSTTEKNDPKNRKMDTKNDKKNSKIDTTGNVAPAGQGR